MTRTRQALIGELGRALQAYQRSTAAFDDEVGRALDLNPADLRCLDWLTEGPLPASRLAAATGLSSAATTSMIDRLERKGFVRRDRHDSDRRQVLVAMTDEGQARTWAIYGRLADGGQRLFARFDKAVLQDLLETLMAMREVTDAERERLREAGRTSAEEAS